MCNMYENQKRRRKTKPQQPPPERTKASFHYAVVRLAPRAKFEQLCIQASEPIINKAQRAEPSEAPLTIFQTWVARII